MFILLWTLDIYFILWDIIQYSFTRNICSFFFFNLDFWKLFQLSPVSFGHTSIIVDIFCLIRFIFECFPTLLHLKMSLAHIHIFAPVLISDFFPSIPLSFYRGMILDIRIFTSYCLCSSPLNWQSKGLHVCPNQWIYTCLYIFLLPK